MEDRLTRSTNTFAIRALVEGLCEEEDLDLDVVNIAPGFNRKGFPLPRKKLVNGIMVYHAPKVGFRNWYTSAGSRVVLRALGLRCSADIMVCHMAKQFVWARDIFRGRAKKWIYVLHASDLHSAQIDLALNQADKILVRSIALKRQLQDRHGVTADGVVFSGLAERDYNENALAYKDCSTLRIIVVAKLIALKNIDAVIEAVARLSVRISVVLDVYGDGPLREALYAHADRLGVCGFVRFHGFQRRSVVLLAMDRAHLLVMPSAPETFGLAYLEAMARGCIVIGHEGWGIDGVIEDEVSGYLVKAPLVDAICGKVNHYLNANKDVMHKKAFECARRHHENVAVRNYSQLILG